MTPLDRITERVNRNGDVNDPSTPRPLLTLEEFFDGNDVDGSIWCNCDPPPSPADALEVLQQIRARPNVKDLRIEVSMFDVPEWPFSEVVYVVTNASPEEVTTWFPESLAPDEASLGFREGYSNEPMTIPSGTQLICCWWD